MHNCVSRICFLVCFFLTTQLGYGSDQDVFSVFSEGYKKNRDSFTNVNCKFLVTQHAQAETIPEALEYKWQITSNTVIRDGILLVKEGNTRFELKCRSDIKKFAEYELKKIKNQSDQTNDNNKRYIVIPCSDVFVISSNDLFRLTYSTINETVNIFPKGVEEGTYGVEYSPFDMGIMARNEYSSPYRYLQDCIRGRFVGHYEGMQEINGQQLEIVTFSTKDSNNHPRMKFGFDPKKGFLATYIVDYNDRTHTPIYEAFITEMKHCSGDRYFPMRSVVVFPENGKFRVSSIEVTALDVDTPLDPNLLCFEIPKGAQVNVPSFDNQWMDAEETILVTPQKIEKLHQNCIAYGKAYLERHQTPPFSNFTEPNLQRGNWLRVILIVAGLILIGIGGGNLIRQWKMKK